MYKSKKKTKSKQGGTRRTNNRTKRTTTKPKGTKRRTVSTAAKKTKANNSRTTKKLNTSWKVGDCIGPKSMWNSKVTWYKIIKDLPNNEWLVRQQGVGGLTDAISKSLERDPYWEKRECPPSAGPKKKPSK